MRKPSRRTVYALAMLPVLAVLCGCAPASAAPWPPSARQLRSLVSEASGYGSDGYDKLGVDIIRFVRPSAWAQVMTTCVRGLGITGVDFRDAHDPYWSLHPDQGAASLSKALDACGLEYPQTSLKPFLLTDEQLRYEFAYLAGPFAEYVAHAGGNYVPPGSLSGFIAQARDFTTSDPFASMKKPASGLSIRSLSRMCPSQAPGL